ncbi:MAG: hypothetical protein GQ470_06110 [Gammaproteobacteria bacterium]|nr:hypothetical protein [Gammaproteobacteria bacterium]
MQDIDVHGEVGKFVITLLVMRHFSALPGASRACADFRDLTAVSRFKPQYTQLLGNTGFSISK